MYYFLRHGESAANASGYAAGQLDVELTEQGYIQANSAGLSITKANLIIDTIVSSGLKRAYQTARTVADVIGHELDTIVTTPLLNESNLGSLAGKPIGSLAKLSLTEQKRAGVETEQQLEARAYRAALFLHEIAVDNILVVSHNSFGRRLVANLRGASVSEVEKFPNAELSQIETRNR